MRWEMLWERGRNYQLRDSLKNGKNERKERWRRYKVPQENVCGRIWSCAWICICPASSRGWQRIWANRAFGPNCRASAPKYSHSRFSRLPKTILNGWVEEAKSAVPSEVTRKKEERIENALSDLFVCWPVPRNRTLWFGCLKQSSFSLEEINPFRLVI